MITRKQYINYDYTHNEYYGQFVNSQIINIVKNYIGYHRIINSKDEYFNNIPLSEWDSLHGSILNMCGEMLRKANGTGGVSLSDTVCVAKVAARWIKENNNLQRSEDHVSADND